MSLFKADDKHEIDMSVINKWTKNNLNLTDEGLGKDHWKNPENGEVYYTWDAAKRLVKKVPSYHLPTAKEWNELAEACGAVCSNQSKKIVDNDYDGCLELKMLLNIKLVGYYNDYSGSFSIVGSFSDFWTADEYDSSYAYSRSFGTEGLMSSSYNLKKVGYSVRLVRDSN